MNETISVSTPTLLRHSPVEALVDSAKIRVCVLITAFNRRAFTLECLRKLTRNLGLQHVALGAVLVDDGSTDGTSEAVKSEFPWVEIVRGDGSLYWCRGMHAAWQVARQRRYDYYLWLNDDTRLNPDSVARLLDCESKLSAGGANSVIVVGSTVDEQAGNLTYGGEVRAAWWRPIRFVKVQPTNEAQPCTSMNGNIVLIPADTARLVGNLDPAFEHAMGDTDYALRANKLGVGVWVAPGIHGTCGHNEMSNTYMDPSLPLTKRWRQMLGRKGLPWRSWLVLTRRHAGFLWPIYFVWPYARLLLSGVISRFKKQ